MIKQGQFNYFSTYLIAKEAEGRGIKVKKILQNEEAFKKFSYLDLKHKGHREIIIGQRTSQTSVIAFWAQRNKQLAKYLLKENGINVSKGRAFKIDKQKEIIDYCKKIKFPIVIKPLSATHGSGVFLGIDSLKEVKEAISEIKKGNHKQALIEEEFKGQEYRIFATKDKFLAATYRIPANVIGDGKSNIKKLVNQKNKDPRRAEGHRKSLVKIKIDPLVKKYLKDQNLTINSVPKKDQQIFLRPNSNLSTGGDSIDYTDKVHPGVKKIAVKAIRSIPGLAYGGLDFLTKDITKAPSSKNYIVIEINDSPMLSMHHIPYEGKSRNVAKEIIDMLFPETKNKR